MTIVHGLAAVPPGHGPSAVTIGKFDGVHQGHRAVLELLRQRAATLGVQSVVVTFDRHPLSLLAPERCPDALLSLRQKTELLDATGVDETVVLAFDRALSELSPEQFVEQVLVSALQARLVLVGADFRFGHRGAGDVARLRELGQEHGFHVEVVDDVQVEVPAAAGRRVSSTMIRELLDAGRVAEAGELMGRPHRIRSVVVHGEKRGRELGYPTANLSPELEGYLPKDGVYAVWALVDGQRYGAAMSIGNNPTFDGVPARQVEVHLFDQALDLYDRELEAEFVAFQRPMMKFMSVDALVDQLQRDDDEIRAVLGVRPRVTA